MKSGTYKVTFEVDIVNAEDMEEAKSATREMVENLIDNGEFPEVNLVFVEGTEIDYTAEEELEELNFDEAS
jgi:hypothetical protein